MLTVGDKLPQFNLVANVSCEMGKEFKDVSNTSFSGKWIVLFFWPLDFTFVCPTEIEAFGEATDKFAENNAVVLGASVDSEFVHLGWRNADPRIKNIPFPLLSDLKRELCSALGILHYQKGAALRATFIIDPQGTIRYASAHDLSTGRNVEEVLRTLEALQSGALCPVNWKKGQKTL